MHARDAHQRYQQLSGGEDDGPLSPELGMPKASQCSGSNHYQALPVILSLNKYFLKSVLCTRKD